MHSFFLTCVLIQNKLFCFSLLSFTHADTVYIYSFEAVFTLEKGDGGNYYCISLVKMFLTMIQH